MRTSLISQYLTCDPFACVKYDGDSTRNSRPEEPPEMKSATRWFDFEVFKMSSSRRRFPKGSAAVAAGFMGLRTLSHTQPSYGIEEGADSEADDYGYSD